VSKELMGRLVAGKLDGEHQELLGLPKQGGPMRKYIAVIVLASWALTGISACTLAGNSFKWSDVKALQPGMTQEEVIKRLGKPTSVQSAGNRMTLVWANVTLTHINTVRLDFEDGKLKELPYIPYE
jgi:hypothetical protein